MMNTQILKAIAIDAGVTIGIALISGRETPEQLRDRDHRVALREALFAAEERKPAIEVAGRRPLVLATSAGATGSGTQLAVCCAA